MNDVTQQQDRDVLTMAAIDEDWWNAVYLPLPESPTAELIDRAHFAVQYCFHGAIGRAHHPDGPWCDADEPQLSAHSKKGDASQHAEAALERLLELERYWPHHPNRISNQPDIPQSIEALQEDLRQHAQELKAASEKPEDARDAEHREEAANETSQRSERTDIDPSSRDETDAEDKNTNDFSFSRGPSGRSR